MSRKIGFYFNNLERAFQMLFSEEFATHDNTLTVDAIEVITDEELPPVNANQVAAMVYGVMNKQLELDSIITKYLRNWTIQRLPSVNLNLLRLAVYELTFGESEKFPGVTINNIVELAKKYGDDKSYKFVNAVLDSYYKNELKK